jgi:hypothetical protein
MLRNLIINRFVFYFQIMCSVDKQDNTAEQIENPLCYSVSWKLCAVSWRMTDAQQVGQREDRNSDMINMLIHTDS